MRQEESSRVNHTLFLIDRQLLPLAFGVQGEVSPVNEVGSGHINS